MWLYTEKVLIELFILGHNLVNAYLYLEIISSQSILKIDICAKRLRCSLFRSKMEEKSDRLLGGGGHPFQSISTFDNFGGSIRFKFPSIHQVLQVLQSRSTA